MAKINDPDKFEVIKKSTEFIGSKEEVREIDKILLNIREIIGIKSNLDEYKYRLLTVDMNRILYDRIDLLTHIKSTIKYQYDTIYGVKLKIVKTDNEEKYYYKVKLDE